MLWLYTGGTKVDSVADLLIYSRWNKYTSPGVVLCTGTTTAVLQLPRKRQLRGSLESVGNKTLVTSSIFEGIERK